ncbi:MAG: class I SAM-dependent methyltransferase, partial [Promethearchaeota archaeon]
HSPGVVPIAEKTLEKVIHEANLGEDAIVLDLGCGAGMQALSIAKQGPFVIGLDLSIAKIKGAKVARDHFALSDKVNFIVADMGALPFTKNAIDAAVSFAVFQHLSEPFEAVKQINKILTPKGKLIIQVPNKISPWYFFIRPLLAKFLQRYRRSWIIDHKVHASYLSNLLKKAGFSKTKTQRFGFLPPGHKNPRYRILYRAIDDAFEKAPLINYFGGILIITGKI